MPKMSVDVLGMNSGESCPTLTTVRCVRCQFLQSFLISARPSHTLVLSQRQSCWDCGSDTKKGRWRDHGLVHSIRRGFFCCPEAKSIFNSLTQPVDKLEPNFCFTLELAVYYYYYYFLTPSHHSQYENHFSLPCFSSLVLHVLLKSLITF